jgi:Domain of unknown function DUF11/WD40-like Beta Propeller Repeat/VHL beta domain
VAAFAALAAFVAASGPFAPAAFANPNCTITQNHSIEGVTPSAIDFVNDSGVRVDVYWLDYDGNPVYYNSLDAGGAYHQDTWLTHPWVILDPSTACIGYTLSSELAQTYHIQPPVESGPTNLHPPKISGTQRVGFTLSADDGRWFPLEPQVDLQWLSCPDACFPIDGATGSTFQVTRAYAGSRLAVRATARSAGGSTTVDSEQTDTIPQLPASGRIFFSSTRTQVAQIFSMEPDGTDQERVSRSGRTDRWVTTGPGDTATGVRIAYSELIGDFEQIVVADGDGSNAQPVTNEFANSTMPALSPDGSRIAFVSDRSGTKNLYLMNVDGSNVQQLTFFTSAAFAELPGWSPDGTTLVFDLCTPTCLLEYLVLGQTPHTFEIIGRRPEYSPDGTQIAYNAPDQDIHVFDLVEGRTFNVTNASGNDFDAAWSPDGTELAYTRVPLDGGNADIYKRTTDFSAPLGPVQLTHDVGTDTTPAWSTEGTQQAAEADLVVTKEATPSPATSGAHVTVRMTVTNNGPSAATNVLLDDSPFFGNASADLVEVTPSQGSCTQVLATHCELGTLAAGASATVTLEQVVTATDQPAHFGDEADVSSDVPDPDLANSEAEIDVPIVSPAVVDVTGVAVKEKSVEAGAKAVPVGNIPLDAIPTLDAEPSSAPIASVPIASVPIASVPIASVPIASVPIASVGWNATNLAAVGGVPLSSLPLAPSKFPNGWTGQLAGTALASSLLQQTTLADVFSLAPEALTPQPPSTKPTVTLADIGLASSPIASVPIASVALGPLTMAQLAGADLAEWCADLDAAGFACAATKLSDGSDLGSTTLATLSLKGAPIASVPIASVPIASVPIASVPIASVPIASVAVAGSPIASVPIASVAVLGSPIASVPIASVPIASVGNVVDCTNYPCATKTLGDALIDHRIKPDAKLSDLGPAILGQITLGQLAQFLPNDITLGDVLAILAGGPEDRGYERLPFTLMPTQDFATNPSSAHYQVAFSLTGGANPGAAIAKLTMPPGFRYAPGSATISGGSLAFVSQVDRELTFDLTNLTPGSHDLNLVLRPSLVLGASGPLAASIEPAGGDEAGGSGGGVDVHEAFEPQNNDPASAPALDADTVYLSHITSASDTDTYRFPITQPGERITVKMVPPAGADYDLSLYRPTRTALRSSPIASVPLDVPAMVDNGLPVTHSSSSLTPESLADVPIASVPIASVSDTRGSAEETGTVVAQAADVGHDLRIDVTGYQASTSAQPYTLLVTVQPAAILPPCAPRTFPHAGEGTAGSLPSIASLPAGLNTVFVVNEKRLGDTYGAAQETKVVSGLTALAGRGDLGVVGAVLPVEGNAGVAGDYTAWDANPCAPDLANAVARDVAGVVDSIRAARPSLKYIVLVGGDDQVPFFRIDDLATVSNETDYAATFLDGNNEYFGSLFSGDVLSDNPYGTPAPIPFLDRFLYVPSIAVGRLVETPDEIANQLQRFQDFSGALDPHTATVTGYDFLTDGATTVANTEKVKLGANAVDTTLIRDDWRKEDLSAALGASPRDVLGLNAHFDHFRLLPADQNAAHTETQLFTTQNLAGVALERRFIFSMGCHAGFSLSDIVVGGPADRKLDWAQAVGAGNGLLAGNTGFGYGDTVAVAYSEKLMALLAKRLDGTLTVGDALLFAKNDYWGAVSTADMYDEKVLSEATFYGLPMYKVGPTVALPPAPPAPATSADPQTGLTVANITTTPTLTPTTSPFGRYYASDDTAVVNYRPVEPQTSVDVTQTGLVAHGAVITSLASTDIAPFDASFSMPTIDRTALSPEPVWDDVIFPSKIQSIRTFADPRGQRQRLVLVVGQFASDPAAAPGIGRQRNFTSLGSRVYYAPPGATDFTAAQFGLVQGSHVGTQAAFSVHVSDPGGGPVKRVLVAFHDGNTWKFVDLAPTAGDATLWTGGAASTTTDPEFFVQAVDGAGNVSVTSFKGRYYETTPPQPPPAGVTVTLAGTRGDNGWFTSPVVATATGPDGLAVSLDGDAFAGTTRNVNADGLHTFAVRSGDQTGAVDVPVDTSSPTVSVTAPAEGAVLAFGSGTKAAFTCADTGSGVASCVGSVASGTDLTKTLGARTLTVTAKDFAGHTTTVVRHFTVVWSFRGFFFPAKPFPQVAPWIGGLALPLVFSLDGFHSLAVVTSTKTQQIACTSTVPVAGNVDAQQALPLVWVPIVDTYILTIKTDRQWRGTCRQVVVGLSDGTLHRANFRFIDG